MVAHAVFQMVASWLFSIAYGVFASAAAILTFGRFSHSLTPKLLRFWGRTMLWIAGVRIELHGAEHLNAPTGKVALFNHSSMLDAFLVTAIMPPGSVAAINAQMGNIAFKTGRKVHWDASANRFRDDAEANALMRARYRDGYVLPTA